MVEDGGPVADPEVSSVARSDIENMATERPGNSDAVDMAKAIVEDATMEETASYLRRGRHLSPLSDDSLREEWIAAFKAWAAGNATTA